MSVEEVRAALPDAERAGEDDRVLGIYRKLTKDVETTTILFEFLEGRLFEIAVIFKMSGDVLTGAEKELVTNLLLNCLGFAGASNDDGRNGWHNEETHAFLGVAQGTCGLTLRSRTHEPFYLREKKLFGLGEPSP
ncbi:MAG: hypothetical protein ACKVPX_06080 [Myxococcaceae bacterium]